MLLVILNLQKVLQRFTKKNCGKTKKDKKRHKRKKEKAKNYILNRKVTIVLLTVGLIKKTWYKCADIFQNRNL